MRWHFQACTVVCAGVLLTSRGFSQNATTSSPTNRVITLHPVSPIDYFRELLVMEPKQRDRTLAGKTPEQKKLLLAKIAEYQSMSPEERELRLRHTELRWQLTRLMKLPPVERMTELAVIPVEKRALIEERLRRWDEVPLPLQKEFLENEAMIQRMLAWETTPMDERAKLTAEQRDHLRRELAAWRGLPEQQRQRMTEQFRQFFELNDEQKKKILGAVPTAEREQMAKTLQQFESLPPETRKRCIDSFSKIAAMNPDERSEFLKNAERWDAMSPSERRAWRDIVNKLPPLPPMPPSMQQRHSPAEVADTNKAR